MLKRALDYFVLAAIWMMTPTAVSPQEPFRPVAGSSLSDRLTNAVKQADSESPGKSFWTAYSFDLRSGVAVGIGRPPAFQGKAELLGGTEVFYGTLNGVPATSRVALFSLHPARSESVSRVAIYNLDKQQRPADGYPVYWLGHATKEEALNDARRLAESGQSTAVRAPATLAVALQDDPRVSETLKNLITKTTDAEVRSIAIASLGQLKTDSDFLADLASKDAKAQTQIEAIKSIARDKNGDAFARLRNVYRPDLQPKVKMDLINTMADLRDKDAVASFLLEVEQNDPSPEIKQHTIYVLRLFDGNSTIDEMMRRFQTEPDESFKNQILYAFSQMNNPRAMEKLFEAARQSDNPRVRREARFLIQQTINGRLARELPKGAGGGKEEEQFDDQAERIMKEQSPEKAVTTFTQIAKTNPNLRIRLRAIFYLIKLDDPRVLDFYSELLSH